MYSVFLRHSQADENVGCSINVLKESVKILEVKTARSDEQPQHTNVRRSLDYMLYKIFVNRSRRNYQENSDDREPAPLATKA